MSELHESRVADYVLGLMEVDAAAAFERELDRDPALAAEVAAGQARLHELDATAPSVAPAGDLWSRIEGRLDGPAPPRKAQAPVRQPLWDRIGFWRIAGLAGIAASLVLAVSLAAVALRPLPAPQYVAILAAADGSPAGAIVEVDPGGAARLIPLVDIPVPQGKALQVWTLQDVAKGPVSLGILGRARGLDLALENLAPTDAGQLFEITLEPETGSPIGRPTGPILYVGRTVRAL